MRILIYSVNFAPELTGIGKYSGEMAAWLSAHGNDVHVVTAPPYYPNWTLQRPNGKVGYTRESWRGVKVWRAPLWVPRRPGGMTRILHLLSFALSSAPLMLRQLFWRPEIVLTVAPAFACAPVGWLTARLCGALAWLHLQDFEVDVALRLGLLRPAWLQGLLLRIERAILHRFDRVSSISNRMVDRLLKKGVHRERTRLFPNWVDTTGVVVSNGKNSFRELLEIDANTIVVLFSGSLTRKQGLMLIPDVAARLSEHNEITFVICGDGVMKSELETATRSMSNVRMLPLQPVERLSELLAMADIHLLPQSPDAADLVMPSKLSGMLASGRPVVATCRTGTEIESIVSHCGIVVPPEDGSATAQAIIELAADFRTRTRLGRCARLWAEDHFEREMVLGEVFGSMVTAVAPFDAALVESSIRVSGLDSAVPPLEPNDAMADDATA